MLVDLLEMLYLYVYATSLVNLRFDSLLHPCISISDLFIYFIFNTHSLFSRNFFFQFYFFLFLIRSTASHSVCIPNFYFNEYTITKFLAVLTFCSLLNNATNQSFWIHFSSLIHSFIWFFVFTIIFHWHLRFSKWLIWLCVWACARPLRTHKWKNPDIVYLIHTDKT